MAQDFLHRRSLKMHIGPKPAYCGVYYCWAFWFVWSKERRKKKKKEKAQGKHKATKHCVMRNI